MPIKNILIGFFLFTSTILSAELLPLKDTPKPTVPKKTERIPQSGTFQDGATLFWMCEDGMKGNVKFGFITNDGKQYVVEVPCVSPTEKTS